MVTQDRSKREHCPSCDGVEMHNHVLVRPGKDVAVFVACADCGEFVARYSLKSYTCDDPYRSFLRLMRQQRMASGSLAASKASGFADELKEEFDLARRLSAEREETRDVEDLLEGIEPGDDD